MNVIADDKVLDDAGKIDAGKLMLLLLIKYKWGTMLLEKKPVGRGITVPA